MWRVWWSENIKLFSTTDVVLSWTSICSFINFFFISSKSAVPSRENNLSLFLKSNQNTISYLSLPEFNRLMKFNPMSCPHNHLTFIISLKGEQRNSFIVVPLILGIINGWQLAWALMLFEVVVFVQTGPGRDSIIPIPPDLTWPWMISQTGLETFTGDYINLTIISRSCHFVWTA